MDRTLCGEGLAVSENETARVSLPTHVYVILGVFGLVMLGLLAGQLMLIEDQRSTVDKQLAIQARQSAKVQPLLEDTQPFVDQVAAALPGARRLADDARELGRDTGALIEAAKPLVADLSDAQIDENL